MMRNVVGWVAGVLLCGSWPAAPAVAAEPVLSVEPHEHGVRILVDGQLFTDYLTDTGPKPILWPIVGPTGQEMTRAYPMREVAGEKQDHPHQRSLWLTHGSVNGVDFWSELEGHGSIRHVSYEQCAASGEAAVLETLNEWLAPDGTRVCTDRRRLTFRATAALRMIDFDVTFAASDGPLTFGDTKEGALGIRVPTVLDVDSGQGGRIVNAEGLTDADAWGKRSPWVDYHGPLDGQVVGVAVLNHPQSFRYPTYWHVRNYGLFAANPFGVHDFTGEGDGAHTTPPGGVLSLHFRYVFHSGDEQAADIAGLYAQYAAESR